jgi:hypothetical protein
MGSPRRGQLCAAPDADADFARKAGTETTETTETTEGTEGTEGEKSRE